MVNLHRVRGSHSPNEFDCFASVGIIQDSSGDVAPIAGRSGDVFKISSEYVVSEVTRVAAHLDLAPSVREFGTSVSGVTCPNFGL